MNKNYFAPGCTYNDHHKEMTVNTSSVNVSDLVRTFFADVEDVTQDAPSAPDVRTELSPADKAILSVHEAGICEPSDWAAVIRLFKELEMMQPNGQPFDAAYINRVCGKPVTSKSSISRSIMSTKIGGKYPYWRIKQDEETRQTPNKLRLYNEIGRIASEALK